MLHPGRAWPSTVLPRAFVRRVCSAYVFKMPWIVIAFVLMVLLLGPANAPSQGKGMHDESELR